MKKKLLYIFLIVFGLCITQQKVDAEEIYDGKPCLNGDMIMTSSRNLKNGDFLEVSTSVKLNYRGGDISLWYKVDGTKYASITLDNIYSETSSTRYQMEDKYISGHYELIGITVYDNNENSTSYDVRDGCVYNRQTYEKEDFKVDMDFDFINPNYINENSPRIKSVSIGKQQVKRGGTIKVKYDIESYGKRIKELAFVFIGKDTGNAYRADTAEDAVIRNGINESEIVVRGLYSQTEEVSLYRVTVSNDFDEYGSYLVKDSKLVLDHWIESHEGTLQEAPITVIADDNPDGDYPILKDIYVEKKQLFNPGNLELYLDIEEKGSGISYIDIYFEREDGSKFREHFSGSALENGQKKFNILFPRYCFGGAYKLYSINIQDYVGNSIYYHRVDTDQGSILRDYNYGETVLEADKADFTVISKEKVDYLIASENPTAISKVRNMKDGETALISFYGSTNECTQKEMFEAIAGTNKTLILENYGIQWVFHGKKVKKEQCKDIYTSVSIDKVSGKEYGYDKDVVRVCFPDNGLLPGEAMIRIQEDYAYRYLKLQGKMYLYFVNSGKTELIDCTPTAESDGYISFPVTHNSTYLLSGEKKTEIETGKDIFNPTYATFDRNSYRVYATSVWKPTLFHDGAEDSVLSITSSNPSVVKVEKNGKLTAKKKGTVVITATLKGNIRAKTKVTVLTPKVTLVAKKLPLQVKKTTTALKVKTKLKTDSVKKWYSSKPKIVSVHPTTGKLKAKKTGTATITCLMKSGAKASCKITVQKKEVKSKCLRISGNNLVIPKGKKVTVSIKREPLTSTDRIYYRIKNKKIASVDKYGRVKGLRKGKTVLQIGLKKQYSYKIPVRVK